MKRSSLFLILTLLISTFTLFQPLPAQEKKKEEKEKDLELQKNIDQLKKSIDEMKKKMKDQSKELEKSMQEYNKAIKNSDDLEFYRLPGRSGHYPIIDEDPYGIGRRDNFPGFTGREGESEKTIWDISRQVNKSTFSKEYTFDVDAISRSFVMSIVGDCKTGDIRVSIIMPGGKTYSEIVIDESGILNWRKSFVINENENKDKTGEWIFRVKVNDATGFFKIFFQTN